MNLFISLILATWLSEDLTCISAGIIASTGQMSLAMAMAACAIGLFSGDFLVFMCGKYFGLKVLHKAPLRWWIKEAQVRNCRVWFEQRGLLVVFLSRFVPGMRFPTYFTAGVTGVSYRRFVWHFVLAVLVWTFLLVGAAYLWGEQVQSFAQGYEHWALPIMVASAICFFVLFEVAMTFVSWEKRRLYLGFLRRKIHWEFWPAWIFYIPLSVYLLALTIKYRGLSFTAVNPMMPHGGVIGESKSEILKALSASQESIARWALIPKKLGAQQRKKQFSQFMHKHSLSYPVVLKPDYGERGKGVRVLYDQASAFEYLDSAKQDMIVQEHVQGEELAVFWIESKPGSGFVFSVTHKQFPKVLGDGKRTVKQLILSDPRAICMYKHYAKAQAQRLDEVLPEGQELQLIEIGSHCRGSVFVDGADFLSEAITKRFQEIVQACPGFDFGRFDLRVQNMQSFIQKGQGFRILELNGVSSEATHIYDRKYSLLQAYKTLFEQWSWAFRIGRHNAQNGHKITSLYQFTCYLFRFL